MLNETFLEVLKHDGVISITSWSDENVHVSNTWNSYLQITEDGKILIPAAWFNRTEKNIVKNNKVIVTLGSAKVQGKIGMGTGFVVDGTARFLTEGADFDMMKGKFPFLTRVLEITPRKRKANDLRGKSVAVEPTEPEKAYDKQEFSAETAATIECKQIAGSYVVEFDR